jgi:hypothetical protein
MAMSERPRQQGKSGDAYFHSRIEVPMFRRTLFAVIAGLGLALALSGAAAAQQTPSTPGAKVYFVNLKNGATVTSPFKVEFGIKGMTIAKAGTYEPGTGHHHLLIDTKLSKADLANPIPSDAQHMHFGGGQTEATLTLPPGKHTLQLVLGDGNHVPFKPPVMSRVITITVK